jgi:hypothetical protein
MRPTLVFIRHCQIGSRSFTHGSELQPDALSREQVDKLLDEGRLVEYDSEQRRSLYRIFPQFSGCSERERLSNRELADCALTE